MKGIKTFASASSFYEPKTVHKNSLLSGRVVDQEEEDSGFSWNPNSGGRRKGERRSGGRRTPDQNK